MLRHNQRPRDMRFALDSSTLASIVTMWKDNPFANKPVAETRQLRGTALEFLTQNSPNKSLLYHPLSPPLFPRRKRRREGTNTLHVGPATIAEATASLHPIDVESMDLDIPKENMILVDGWSTSTPFSSTLRQYIDSRSCSRAAALVSSSQTATPSLSSGSSEVDELNDAWLPTSEADMTVPILAADSKMGTKLILCQTIAFLTVKVDEYQMPRDKRARKSFSSKDSQALDRKR